MSSQLIDYFISNKMIVLKLEEGLEISITLDVLRKSCPCANCGGEKDVFGNIYKGPIKELNDSAFKIQQLSLVGHYAIRIFWEDGHSNGIYTFDLLKNLNE